MGQTLSSPMSAKTTASGGNDRYTFAISEMQGWRVSMEDAHAVVLDLDEGKTDSNTFFAVYDGHGGGAVAKFAGENVHKRLVTEETYQQKDYEAAMKRAFLGTDEDLLANNTRDPSGCTAVAALVTSDGKIYVANAGDSRSVIGIKGEVKPLSFDHKPSSNTEKERIHAAGGYIEYGRVNGNLALSRALGDFEFKKNYTLSPQRQIITADPDVTCHEITEDDEFLVLACDGIWDCLSSQQVIDVIRYQISEGKELPEICEMICDHCLAPDTSSGAGIGCDNMTILIVGILHGRTKEDWQAWITDRVKNNYGWKTPNTIPRLYAQSRLMAFRARQEDNDRRKKNAEPTLEEEVMARYQRIVDNTPDSLMFRSTPEGLVRVYPESGFGDSEMYIREDEDDMDEEEDSHDINEVEPSERRMEQSNDPQHLQGEAPPPPKPLPNGDASTAPVEQLKSQPHGDEPLPVVKAEGLLDTSEDPLVQA